MSRALTPAANNSFKANIEFWGFFSFDMRPQCKSKTSAPFSSSFLKVSFLR